MKSVEEVLNDYGYKVEEKLDTQDADTYIVKQTELNFIVRVLDFKFSTKGNRRRLNWRWWHHPNVVGLKEYFVNGNRIFFVLENFTRNEVAKYFSTQDTPRGAQRESLCKKWTEQCLLALKHASELGLFYDSFSFDHVVLDGNMNAKIFGVDNLKYVKPVSSLNRCCNKLIRANRTTRRQDAEKTEVWKVGAALLELLLENSMEGPNFQTGGSQDKKLIATNIKNNVERLSGHLSATDLSPECQDFLMNCLVQKPQNQLSIAAALDHVWFKKDTHKDVSYPPSLQYSEEMYPIEEIGQPEPPESLVSPVSVTVSEEMLYPSKVIEEYPTGAEYPTPIGPPILHPADEEERGQEDFVSAEECVDEKIHPPLDSLSKKPGEGLEEEEEEEEEEGALLRLKRLPSSEEQLSEGSTLVKDILTDMGTSEASSRLAEEEAVDTKLEYGPKEAPGELIDEDVERAAMEGPTLDERPPGSIILVKDIISDKGVSKSDEEIGEEDIAISPKVSSQTSYYSAQPVVLKDESISGSSVSLEPEEQFLPIDGAVQPAGSPPSRLERDEGVPGKMEDELPVTGAADVIRDKDEIGSKKSSQPPFYTSKLLVSSEESASSISTRIVEKPAIPAVATVQPTLAPPSSMEEDTIPSEKVEGEIPVAGAAAVIRDIDKIGPKRSTKPPFYTSKLLLSEKESVSSTATSLSKGPPVPVVGAVQPTLAAPSGVEGYREPSEELVAEPPVAGAAAVIRDIDKIGPKKSTKPPFYTSKPLLSEEESVSSTVTSLPEGPSVPVVGAVRPTLAAPSRLEGYRGPSEELVAELPVAGAAAVIRDIDKLGPKRSLKPPFYASKPLLSEEESVSSTATSLSKGPPVPVVGAVRPTLAAASRVEGYREPSEELVAEPPVSGAAAVIKDTDRIGPKTSLKPPFYTSKLLLSEEESVSSTVTSLPEGPSVPVVGAVQPTLAAPSTVEGYRGPSEELVAEPPVAGAAAVIRDIDKIGPKRSTKPPFYTSKLLLSEEESVSSTVTSLSEGPPVPVVRPTLAAPSGVEGYREPSEELVAEPPVSGAATVIKDTDRIGPKRSVRPPFYTSKLLLSEEESVSSTVTSLTEGPSVPVIGAAGPTLAAPSKLEGYMEPSEAIVAEPPVAAAVTRDADRIGPKRSVRPPFYTSKLLLSEEESVSSTSRTSEERSVSVISTGRRLPLPAPPSRLEIARGALEKLGAKPPVAGAALIPDTATWIGPKLPDKPPYFVTRRLPFGAERALAVSKAVTREGFKLVDESAVSGALLPTRLRPSPVDGAAGALEKLYSRRLYPIAAAAAASAVIRSTAQLSVAPSGGRGTVGPFANLTRRRFIPADDSLVIGTSQSISLYPSSSEAASSPSGKLRARHLVSTTTSVRWGTTAAPRLLDHTTYQAPFGAVTALPLPSSEASTSSSLTTKTTARPLPSSEASTSSSLTTARPLTFSERSTAITDHSSSSDRTTSTAWWLTSSDRSTSTTLSSQSDGQSVSSTRERSEFTDAKTAQTTFTSVSSLRSTMGPPGKTAVTAVVLGTSHLKSDTKLSSQSALYFSQSFPSSDRSTVSTLASAAQPPRSDGESDRSSTSATGFQLRPPANDSTHVDTSMAVLTSGYSLESAPGKPEKPGARITVASETSVSLDTSQLPAGSRVSSQTTLYVVRADSSGAKEPGWTAAIPSREFSRSAQVTHSPKEDAGRVPGTLHVQRPIAGATEPRDGRRLPSKAGRFTAQTLSSSDQRSSSTSVSTTQPFLSSGQRASSTLASTVRSLASSDTETRTSSSDERSRRAGQLVVFGTAQSTLDKPSGMKEATSSGEKLGFVAPMFSSGTTYYTGSVSGPSVNLSAEEFVTTDSAALTSASRPDKCDAELTVTAATSLILDASQSRAIPKLSNQTIVNVLQALPPSYDGSRGTSASPIKERFRPADRPAVISRSTAVHPTTMKGISRLVEQSDVQQPGAAAAEVIDDRRHLYTDPKRTGPSGYRTAWPLLTSDTSSSLASAVHTHPSRDRRTTGRPLPFSDTSSTLASLARSLPSIGRGTNLGQATPSSDESSGSTFASLVEEQSMPDDNLAQLSLVSASSFESAAAPGEKPGSQYCVTSEAAVNLDHPSHLKPSPKWRSRTTVCFAQPLLADDEGTHDFSVIATKEQIRQADESPIVGATQTTVLYPLNWKGATKPFRTLDVQQPVGDTTIMDATRLHTGPELTRQTSRRTAPSLPTRDISSSLASAAHTPPSRYRSTSTGQSLPFRDTSSTLGGLSQSVPSGVHGTSIGQFTPSSDESSGGTSTRMVEERSVTVNGTAQTSVVSSSGIEGVAGPVPKLRSRVTLCFAQPLLANYEGTRDFSAISTKEQIWQTDESLIVGAAQTTVLYPLNLKGAAKPSGTLDDQQPVADAVAIVDATRLRTGPELTSQTSRRTAPSLPTRDVSSSLATPPSRYSSTSTGQSQPFRDTSSTLGGLTQSVPSSVHSTSIGQFAPSGDESSSGTSARMVEERSVTDNSTAQTSFVSSSGPEGVAGPVPKLRSRVTLCFAQPITSDDESTRDFSVSSTEEQFRKTDKSQILGAARPFETLDDQQPVADAAIMDTTRLRPGPELTSHTSRYPGRSLTHSDLSNLRSSAAHPPSRDRSTISGQSVPFRDTSSTLGILSQSVPFNVPGTSIGQFTPSSDESSGSTSARMVEGRSVTDRNTAQMSLVSSSGFEGAAGPQKAHDSQCSVTSETAVNLDPFGPKLRSRTTLRFAQSLPSDDEGTRDFSGKEQFRQTDESLIVGASQTTVSSPLSLNGVARPFETLDDQQSAADAAIMDATQSRTGPELTRHTSDYTGRPLAHSDLSSFRTRAAHPPSRQDRSTTSGQSLPFRDTSSTLGGLSQSVPSSVYGTSIGQLTPSSDESSGSTSARMVEGRPVTHCNTAQMSLVSSSGFEGAAGTQETLDSQYSITSETAVNLDPFGPKLRSRTTVCFAQPLPSDDESTHDFSTSSTKEQFRKTDESQIIGAARPFETLDDQQPVADAAIMDATRLHIGPELTSHASHYPGRPLSSFRSSAAHPPSRDRITISGQPLPFNDTSSTLSSLAPSVPSNVRFINIGQLSPTSDKRSGSTSASLVEGQSVPVHDFADVSTAPMAFVPAPGFSGVSRPSERLDVGYPDASRIPEIVNTSHAEPGSILSSQTTVYVAQPPHSNGKDSCYTSASPSTQHAQHVSKSVLIGATQTAVLHQSDLEGPTRPSSDVTAVIMDTTQIHIGPKRTSHTGSHAAPSLPDTDKSSFLKSSVKSFPFSDRSKSTGQPVRFGDTSTAGAFEGLTRSAPSDVQGASIGRLSASVDGSSSSDTARPTFTPMSPLQFSTRPLEKLDGQFCVGAETAVTLESSQSNVGPKLSSQTTVCITHPDLSGEEFQPVDKSVAIGATLSTVLHQSDLEGGTKPPEKLDAWQPATGVPTAMTDIPQSHVGPKPVSHYSALVPEPYSGSSTSVSLSSVTPTYFSSDSYPSSDVTTSFGQPLPCVDRSVTDTSSGAEHFVPFIDGSVSAIGTVASYAEVRPMASDGITDSLTGQPTLTSTSSLVVSVAPSEKVDVQCFVSSETAVNAVTPHLKPGLKMSSQSTLYVAPSLPSSEEGSTSLTEDQLHPTGATQSPLLYPSDLEGTAVPPDHFIVDSATGSKLSSHTTFYTSQLIPSDDQSTSSTLTISGLSPINKSTSTSSLASVAHLPPSNNQSTMRTWLDSSKESPLPVDVLTSRSLLAHPSGMEDTMGPTEKLEVKRSVVTTAVFQETARFCVGPRSSDQTSGDDARLPVSLDGSSGSRSAILSAEQFTTADSTALITQDSAKMSVGAKPSSQTTYHTAHPLQSTCPVEATLVSPDSQEFIDSGQSTLKHLSSLSGLTGSVGELEAKHAAAHARVVIQGTVQMDASRPSRPRTSEEFREMSIVKDASAFLEAQILDATHFCAAETPDHISATSYAPDRLAAQHGTALASSSNLAVSIDPSLYKPNLMSESENATQSSSMARDDHIHASSIRPERTPVSGSVSVTRPSRRDMALSSEPLSTATSSTDYVSVAWPSDSEQLRILEQQVLPPTSSSSRVESTAPGVAIPSGFETAMVKLGELAEGLKIAMANITQLGLVSSSSKETDQRPSTQPNEDVIGTSNDVSTTTSASRLSSRHRSEVPLEVQTHLPMVREPFIAAHREYDPYQAKSVLNEAILVTDEACTTSATSYGTAQSSTVSGSLSRATYGTGQQRSVAVFETHSFASFTGSSTLDSTEEDQLTVLQISSHFSREQDPAENGQNDLDRTSTIVHVGSTCALNTGRYEAEPMLYPSSIASSTRPPKNRGCQRSSRPTGQDGSAMFSRRRWNLESTRMDVVLDKAEPEEAESLGCDDFTSLWRNSRMFWLYRDSNAVMLDDSIETRTSSASSGVKEKTDPKTSTPSKRLSLEDSIETTNDPEMGSLSPESGMLPDWSQVRDHRSRYSGSIRVHNARSSQRAAKTVAKPKTDKKDRGARLQQTTFERSSRRRAKNLQRQEEEEEDDDDDDDDDDEGNAMR